MDDSRIGAILHDWFGPLVDETSFPEERARRWFQGGMQVDQEIRDRFGDDLRDAIRGALERWKETTRGRLALILLLDQFSRNVYRGSPKAFAQDRQALALALEGIEQGVDRRLHPVEALFFYLPLEHAEDPVMQDMSVACFTRLAERAPPAIEFPIRNALDYAKRHQRIIERFGRFPHRNEILQRTSTPEELAFLTEPGSAF